MKSAVLRNERPGCPASYAGRGGIRLRPISPGEWRRAVLRCPDLQFSRRTGHSNGSSTNRRSFSRISASFSAVSRNSGIYTPTDPISRPSAAVTAAA